MVGLMNKDNKPNKKRYDDGEITYDEWRRLNYEYFGENNVDWIEGEDDDEDDEVKELDFNH